jgi:hypothetical protein
MRQAIESVTTHGLLTGCSRKNKMRKPLFYNHLTILLTILTLFYEEEREYLIIVIYRAIYRGVRAYIGIGRVWCVRCVCSGGAV